MPGRHCDAMKQGGPKKHSYTQCHVHSTTRPSLGNSKVPHCRAAFCCQRTDSCEDTSEEQLPVWQARICSGQTTPILLSLVPSQMEDLNSCNEDCSIYHLVLCRCLPTVALPHAFLLWNLGTLLLLTDFELALYS